VGPRSSSLFGLGSRCRQRKKFAVSAPLRGAAAVTLPAASGERQRYLGASAPPRATAAGGGAAAATAARGG